MIDSSEPLRYFTLEDALKGLKNVACHGDYKTADCPCCGKENHLYIRDNGDNKLVVRCMKCGVATKKVAKALREAGFEGTGTSLDGVENTVYVYTDRLGNPLFYKERSYINGKKTFQFYHYNDGRKVFGLPQGLPLLYNKAGLELAPEDTTLYIVEGEKDVDTLTDLGLLATTTHTGARNGKIELTEDDLEQLNKFPNKVVIPDNDAAGESYIATWPKECAVLKLPWVWPDCPRKGDVTDYIEAGKDINAILNFKIVDWQNDDEICELGREDFLNRDILTITSLPYYLCQNSSEMYGENGGSSFSEFELC